MEPVTVAGAPTWHVEITGDPCVTVDLDLRKHQEDRRRTTAEQYALAGAVLDHDPGRDGVRARYRPVAARDAVAAVAAGLLSGAQRGERLARCARTSAPVRTASGSTC